MRKVAAHQVTASDLNTFTITFLVNMPNEVCHDYNLKSDDELIGLKGTDRSVSVCSMLGATADTCSSQSTEAFCCDGISTAPSSGSHLFDVLPEFMYADFRTQWYLVRQ